MQTKKEKKTKTVVIVRALKTRIYNPLTRQREICFRGHRFEKPWPELIKLAREDIKHRVLAVIEETTGEEEK